jgi:hypothetical protein
MAGDGGPGRAKRRSWGPEHINAAAAVASVLVAAIGIGVTVYFATRSSSNSDAQQSLGPSAATASASASGAIGVENVYNIPWDRARPILTRQGFTDLVENTVCSNSIAKNNVREVIVDNSPTSASQEIDLVDENGTTSTRVKPGTALIVKVSDGNTC